MEVGTGDTLPAVSMKADGAAFQDFWKSASLSCHGVVPLDLISRNVVETPGLRCAKNQPTTSATAICSTTWQVA